jgi:transcriptional regulator with XRE-family HTH domain
MTGGDAMDDPLVVLAHNMRRRRRALNLTQEAASDRVGMNMSYWGRVERARIEPGVRTMVRIAAALDTAPAELLAGFDAGELVLHRVSPAGSRRA